MREKEYSIFGDEIIKIDYGKLAHEKKICRIIGDMNDFIENLGMISGPYINSYYRDGVDIVENKEGRLICIVLPPVRMESELDTSTTTNTASFLAAAPELFIALIRECLKRESDGETELIGNYSIKAMEKATGKSWEVIKALYETP